MDSGESPDQNGFAEWLHQSPDAQPEAQAAADGAGDESGGDGVVHPPPAKKPRPPKASFGLLQALHATIDEPMNEDDSKCSLSWLVG